MLTREHETQLLGFESANSVADAHTASDPVRSSRHRTPLIPEEGLLDNCGTSNEVSCPAVHDVHCDFPHPRVQ